MPADRSHLDQIVALATDLTQSGFGPVMVGGMALVILGSQRVTKDYDLLISARPDLRVELLELAYHHGFELISKLSPEGEVVRTIDNPRVAAARVKADELKTLFLFDRRGSVRVDLMMDFPVEASSLLQRAVKTRLPSGDIYVASPADLLRLKEMAYADRKAAKDAQDLEFLRKKVLDR